MNQQNVNSQASDRPVDLLSATMTAQQVQTWLISNLARLLEVEEAEIDPNIPLESYGLDSEAAIGLLGDLEELLHIEIDPSVIYDSPTLTSLAEYAAAEASQ